MSLMLLLLVDLNALNAWDNNFIFSDGPGVRGDGISSVILIITASDDDTSTEVFSFISFVPLIYISSTILFCRYSVYDSNPEKCSLERMEERKSKRSPENHDDEKLWKKMLSRSQQVFPDM
jgi:hypothetical protein